jgi:hypothetical protein
MPTAAFNKNSKSCSPLNQIGLSSRQQKFAIPPKRLLIPKNMVENHFSFLREFYRIRPVLRRFARAACCIRKKVEKL